MISCLAYYILQEILIFFNFQKIRLKDQQERQQQQVEHAKQVAGLQDVVSQLTEELTLMRRQYERLQEEKLVSEVQLQQQVYELQSSLEQVSQISYFLSF